MVIHEVSIQITDEGKQFMIINNYNQLMKIAHILNVVLLMICSWLGSIYLSLINCVFVYQTMCFCLTDYVLLLNRLCASHV